MSSSGGSGGSHLLDPSGPLVSTAIQALPEDVQALLKPGKTSDRIQHAITWASRLDPAVIELHHAHDQQIKSFADIRAASLAHKDAVARDITRRYRHRALLTGAITGLPGGLWALVAAGADVQLTAIYAVRMASMVAQAYGYDTSLLEEQAHLADVLALVAGIDSLRGVGNYLTRQGLIHMVPDILPRLLARISVEITEDQAAKWVGRIIPGFGAAVGGAIDYAFLRAAGERALTYYHDRAAQDVTTTLPGVRAAMLPPGVTPSMGVGRPPRIVEGTLTSSEPPAVVGEAAPIWQRGVPAPVPAPAAPAERTLASHTATAAPLPKKHRRSPERFAVYLAFFAFFALGITVLACAALSVLVYQAAQHLVH